MQLHFLPIDQVFLICVTKQLKKKKKGKIFLHIVFDRLFNNKL